MSYGYWNIRVPVSPEEVDADMALLKQLEAPEGVVLWSCEVVVHGRLWEWERLAPQVEDGGVIRAFGPRRGER